MYPAMTRIASASFLRWMYEALVCRGGRGGYLPALAESWTLEDDACTWTFNLRSPVIFHNGDTLEAQDVVATLERIGAVIKALDERTVRIVTAEPLADLLAKFPIAPRRALTGLSGTPVGSGSYRLIKQSHESAEQIVSDAHCVI